MDIGGKRKVKDIIDNGMWREKITGWGDLRVKVRPINNPQYDVLYAKLMKAAGETARENTDLDEADINLGRNIQNELIVENLLVDWGNMKDGGADVPYSKEMARTLIFDPLLPDFREMVWEQATQVAAMNIAAFEKTRKNSSAS